MNSDDASETRGKEPYVTLVAMARSLSQAGASAEAFASGLSRFGAATRSAQALSDPLTVDMCEEHLQRLPWYKIKRRRLAREVRDAALARMADRRKSRATEHDGADIV